MLASVRAMMVAGAISGLFGLGMLACGDTGNGTSGTGQSGGQGGQGGSAGHAGAGGEGGQGGGMGCTEGQTKPCYTGDPGTENMGVCKAGTTTCAGGVWGSCEGEVLPSAEVCDGADQDCNGQVDDAIAPIMCGVGACQVTVEGCVDGKVPACEPLMPTEPETCNGIDDNCDGNIDEGDICPCTDGATQSCYSGNPATMGVGTCMAGTQTCVAGAWGACENEVLPAMEGCDGLDNDCDGMNDEDLGQITCGGGACLVTVQACINGQPQPCTPLPPKPEVCNGLDDDCNLLIDDGLGSTTCGTGACLVTQNNCAGGQPQVCKPGMPSPEVCDGIDNNCNGITDEGNPGGGLACNTGLSGACAMGTLFCENGALKCNPNVMPVPETCDNKDNNCNGTIDEGNPGGGLACNTGLPGLCAFGTTKCNAGMIGCTQTNMPTNETCDGVDNNCNGATDEGTSGAACTVPGKVGACAVSTFVCQNGSLLCPQTVQPTNEICNNVDDNCNGTVDDGNPGGGANCNVAGKLGECAKGLVQCTNGALSCAQTIFPMSEACGDGKDNDCDGAIDNGCCPHSVCQAGVAMPASCLGNACVSNVCTYGGGGFSNCCTNGWTNGCTAVADFACGAGTCCTHNVCTAGPPLVNGCSSCVTAVCTAIPSCCTTAWDQTCINSLNTYCGVQCN